MTNLHFLRTIIKVEKVMRKRSTHIRPSERAAHRVQGGLVHGMWKVAFELKN